MVDGGDLARLRRSEVPEVDASPRAGAGPGRETWARLAQVDAQRWWWEVRMARRGLVDLAECWTNVTVCGNSQ